MKNILTILILLMFAFSSAFSQEIIENPGKPLNKDAGRVLELQEVFRISDETGEFYFKSPKSFKISADNCLFVIDENQFLKFSNDGKILKNLFKKGQGPGEITTSSHRSLSYLFSGGTIYLYDRAGGKIIHMTQDGDFIKDIKLEIPRFNELIGLLDGGFVFLDEEPIPRGYNGFKDVAMSIIWASNDGISSKKIMEVPKKIYSGKSGNGMFGMDWTRFYFQYDNNSATLYVSHTSNYRIAQANLSEGQVIKSFNRKYNRIKFVIPEWSKDFYQRFKPPEKKFEDDIFGMFLINDALWVKTSLVDKDKGMLFDLFDTSGRYTDSFYLNIHGSLELVVGEHIYIAERDEDENISIKKLRILNLS